MFGKVRRSLLVSIALAGLWAAMAPMAVHQTISSVPGHAWVASGSVATSDGSAGGDDTGWD